MTVDLITVELTITPLGTDFVDTSASAFTPISFEIVPCVISAWLPTVAPITTVSIVIGVGLISGFVNDEVCDMTNIIGTLLRGGSKSVADGWIDNIVNPNESQDKSVCPMVIVVPGGAADFEVYCELLSAQPAVPEFTHGAYLYGLTTFKKLDPSAFDGTLEWFFELIGMNIEAWDVVVSVVDSAYNVCASITLPATVTTGTTGYELLRQRATFTPTADTVYGLMVSVPEPHQHFTYYPIKCMITTARIVAKQSGSVTKTRLQIPLFATYWNYNLQEYGVTAWDLHPKQPRWPFDCPGGYPVSIAPVYTNDWYGAEAASLWTYLESEIGTPAEVVFSAYAESTWYRPVDKGTLTNYSSVPYTMVRHMLYWASKSAGCGQAGATPDGWVGESQSYVDDADPTVTYTPIAGSHFYTTDFPFVQVIQHFYFSEVGTSYIHLGGLINDVPGWYATPRFKVTVAADTRLNFTVTYTYTDPTHYTVNIKYAVEPLVAPSSLFVALMDLDTGTVVTGSELEWVHDEGQSRKYSSALTLIDGHTYTPCVKFDEDDENLDVGELMDAELLINLNPITELTIWQRVGHADILDNWDIPEAYDFAEPQSRVALYQKACVSATYLEVIAYRPNPDWGNGTIGLSDQGTSDLEMAGTGTEVANSEVTFVSDSYLPEKQRSAALTLTDGNRYVSRNPDMDDLAVLIQAFIVQRILLGSSSDGSISEGTLGIDSPGDGTCDMQAVLYNSLNELSQY